MPPSLAPHVLAWFWEAGPALPGPHPLTHSEIGAWERGAGIRLQPWHRSLLRRLSCDYVDECIQAADPQAPAPWVGARDEQKRAVASDLRASIAGLAKL